MTRIINSVRIVLLFIAVLAIIGHMVLPHDHHLADSFTCEKHECPVSDNESSHNTGMPVHCNACNDLTSEKSVILVVVSHFESKFFPADSRDQASSPLLNLACYVEDEISVKHSDSDYTGINLLRAPPAFI